MASNPVVKDEGKTYIASSQRPDGTWRKERAVKPGFVPQEEVPLYESRGKRFVKQQAEAMPAGLTPEIWEQMKQQQKKNSAGQKKKKNKSKSQASV